MKHTLGMAIGDAPLDDTLRAVAQLPGYREPPLSLELDDEPAGVESWPSTITSCTREGRASWGEAASGTHKLVTVNKLVTTTGNRVNIQWPEAFETISEALNVIESLPFLIASFGTIHLRRWMEMNRKHVGFGNRHYSHGWACAFRGNGHDRLASRRWLDFGPWRVIRRPGDLTLVQFHDLAADAETAYAQALPGWERMGISVTGGYLQSPYTFRTVEGLYHADTRLLEVVVPPGGKVKPLQMRDAAAVRVRHPSAPEDGKPIEQVAFVFLDEADAREHLHELWLRELEVWLVDGDGKRRLDLDYHPTPTRPAWVTSLGEDP